MAAFGSVYSGRSRNPCLVSGVVEFAGIGTALKYFAHFQGRYLLPAKPQTVGPLRAAGSGQRPEMWKLFKDDSVVGAQGVLTLKMK